MDRRKRVFAEWFQIVFGLLIFAFGVHLTIFANIGLAPWDCLGMGLSYHTPLNYGLCMTFMSLVIVGLDLLMGEKIGFGTLIDALVTGNFVQMFNDLNPLPENNSLPAGIACMLAGFVFMAVGMFFHMRSAQCCGPRDAMLVGLGKRMRRIPIGIVQIMLWAIVLLTGWLLGGPVGIGTLLSTFGGGIVMQFVFNALRFEPRDVVHRSFSETVRELLGNGHAEAS